MRLLLDAHTLLWWLASNKKLGKKALAKIASSSSTVYVSAAVVWEISIKHALGKLDAPSDLERQIESNLMEPLSITVGHAFAAGALPRIHNDPFDRMLIAQAEVEQLTIVTADPIFERYRVATLDAGS